MVASMGNVDAFFRCGIVLVLVACMGSATGFATLPLSASMRIPGNSFADSARIATATPALVGSSRTARPELFSLAVFAVGVAGLALRAHQRKQHSSRGGLIVRKFMGGLPNPFGGGGRAPTPADVTTKVFFDVAVDGDTIGTITFGLFGDVVPKTVENFRTLCVGKDGKPLYKGSPFHRIIPGFMCQGGDYTNRNGTGGASIYGGMFDDENFDLTHSQSGLLSMANRGPGTNGSQFFITTGATGHLDGKHVVFGMVLDGGSVIGKMESLGSMSGQTRGFISIANCGAA